MATRVKKAPMVLLEASSPTVSDRLFWTLVALAFAGVLVIALALLKTNILTLGAVSGEGVKQLRTQAGNSLNNLGDQMKNAPSLSELFGEWPATKAPADATATPKASVKK